MWKAGYKPQEALETAVGDHMEPHIRSKGNHLSLLIY